MMHRRMGSSGWKVPVLSFGTGTFGGVGEFFGRWGATQTQEAQRLVDICLERGVNFFDTADVYSQGRSEEILGATLKGRRDRALICTKATFTMGSSPNDKGSSRFHLTKALDASLKRLGTDYVDLYLMHAFDALTPAEEVMSTLDDFVRAGKVRYTGISNYASWQVMKAQSCAERYGYNKHVCYQGYYSLIGREYEHELMPMALDQGIGTMVWSPLGWGRLTGKIRRGVDESGRIAAGGDVGGPEVEPAYLYRVVDALEQTAGECQRSIAQVALNWLLTRPSVASVVIGARNEAQLLDNLGALDFELSLAQRARLDHASYRTPVYPYWHQRDFDERNPKPTKW